MSCMLVGAPTMPFITHVGTALPRNTIDQQAVAAVVARSLDLGAGQTATLHALFENTHVQHRHSVSPLEQIGQRRSLTECMALYREHALELALAAARDCLAQARLAPARVDFVITASCTGVLLPSLAALLVEPLGLRNDVRRLPITESGCAGGASALAQAHDFLLAFPRSRVLVIAVELPSLTFQHGDASAANLVASAIFGDGAAAALVHAEESGVEIVATHTALLPASLGDMGFDLRDSGLHVVLSKHVPRIIAQGTPAVVRQFLNRCEVTPQEIAFYVLHPGGRRVLEALESSLELAPSRTSASWDVLRDHGNQSSASVLFVLKETLNRGLAPGYGLLAAFGPGITVELALLRA